MVDTCTIARTTAQGAFDRATGDYGAPTTAVVYSGACRVKPRDNQDHVVQVGEQPLSLWPFVVSVPISVTDVDVDHVVTITASALDPALVGTQMRVRQVIRGSFVTARRLGCEVNAG